VRAARSIAAVAVAVLGCAALLTGCSGSGSGSGSAPPSSSTSSAGASPSLSPEASAEVGRTADQIFDDSLAAMRRVDHVRITGTQTDATGTYTLSGDITRTAARIDIVQGGSRLVVVITGGKAYASQDGSGFVELSSIEELRAQASTLTKTLECAGIERGKLTKGAVTTIRGTPAIAIDDDGKVPGDAPNVTYIALDGSLHVVESRTTGTATPGGSNACGHSPTDTLSAAQTEYEYQAPAPAVTPPPVVPGGSSSSATGPII
jgi:hypothetical protein